MSLVTQISKEQIERLQSEMAALPQAELVKVYDSISQA